MGVLHSFDAQPKRPPERATLPLRVLTRESELYVVDVPATHLAKVPELQFLLADKLLSEEEIEGLLGVSIEMARLYSSLPWMMDDSDFERMGQKFQAVVSRALAGGGTLERWEKEVLKEFAARTQFPHVETSSQGQVNVGPKRKRGMEEERPGKRRKVWTKVHPVPDFLSDFADRLSLRRDESVEPREIERLQDEIGRVKAAMEKGPAVGSEEWGRLQGQLDLLGGSAFVLGWANLYDASVGAALAVLMYSGTHYYLWAVQHAFRQAEEAHLQEHLRATRVAESSMEERAELAKRLRWVEGLASETERARLRERLSELKQLIGRPERIRSGWDRILAAQPDDVLDRERNLRESGRNMEKYMETGEERFLRLHELHVILVAALDAGEGERLRSFGPSPLGELVRHYRTVEGTNVVGGMDMGRESVFLPRPVEKLAVVFPEWEVDLALKVTGDWELLVDALHMSHAQRCLKFLTVAAAACASRYRDLFDFARDFPDGSLELRAMDLSAIRSERMRRHFANRPVLLAEDSKEQFERYEPMAVGATVSRMYGEFVSAMGRRTGIPGREVSRWFPKEWYAEALGAHHPVGSNSSGGATVSTDVLTHWVVPYFWSQVVRSGELLYPPSADQMEELGHRIWNLEPTYTESFSTVPLEKIYMLFRGPEIIPFKSVVVAGQFEFEKFQFPQCLFVHYVTSLLFVTSLRCKYSYWCQYFVRYENFAEAILKLENLYELKMRLPRFDSKHKSVIFGGHSAPEKRLRSLKSIMTNGRVQSSFMKDTEDFEKLENLSIQLQPDMTFEPCEYYLHNLWNLKFLSLENSNVMDYNLRHLIFLEDLNVSNCERLIGSGFTNLVRLRRLNVQGCVNLQKSKAFETLANLTFLNATNFYFRCSELKGLKSLKILSVDHLSYDCHEVPPPFRLHELHVVEFDIIETLRDRFETFLPGFQNLKILHARASEYKMFTSRVKNLERYIIKLLINLEELYAVRTRERKRWNYLELTGSNLFSLKRLKILDVSNSESFRNSALAGLTNLEELRASRTSLTGSNFEHLKKLKILDVQKCKDFKNSTFVNLTNLEELRARGTSLTGSNFEHLKKLKILHVQKCESLTDSALADLPSLEELRADHTNLTGSHFHVLDKLKILDVSYCKKLRDSAFVGLFGLEELRANHTELTGSNFEHLKNLRILQLFRCKNLKNPVLAGLIRLEKLFIDDLAVASLENNLEQLENLKILHVVFYSWYYPDYCIGGNRLKRVSYYVFLDAQPVRSFVRMPYHHLFHTYFFGNRIGLDQSQANFDLNCEEEIQYWARSHINFSETPILAK